MQIPILSQKDLDRFWAKVDKKSEDECWPWTASKRDGQYGAFGIANRTYYANRVALYIATGVEGIAARHSCDNPICCNPKHLSWGTQLDNMTDKMDKGRHVQVVGKDNGRAILVESDVLQIRASHASGSMSVKQLSVCYQVHPNTIYDILNRKKWKHI